MAGGFLILFAVLLVRLFFRRNMPRVGGKIGPRRTVDPPVAAPDGFSRVYARVMTLFVASSDAAGFANLNAFLRHGTKPYRALMRIYRVAGCKTEIEIPVESTDYERIDAAEALALLRELPDPRLILRLHLSDQPSFLDPWVRKVAGQDSFLLGNATSYRLVVLYKPDRRHRSLVGLTLLHEWLHIVAFGSAMDVWQFRRADAIEPLTLPAIAPVSFGVRKAPTHEAWCDLGEKLFGYDETIARDAALATPVHAMILWRRIDKIMRQTPARFCSTRFAEFEKLGDFMRTEITARASTIRANRS